MGCLFEPEWDKALDMPNKCKIGHLPKDPKIFLCRSTIYYGASETGKSTLMREELFLIRNYIENVCAFIPNANETEDYKGVFPSKCIHTKLTKKKIRQIFDRQQEIVRLYRIVNSMDNLKTMFKYVERLRNGAADYHTITRDIANSETYMIRMVANIDNSKEFNFAEKKENISKIKKVFEDKCRRLYKTTISKYKKSLCAICTDEFVVSLIQNIDLNPNTLLYFDDCVSDIAAISGKSGKNKQGESTPSCMDLIFERGRHMYFTTIVATQDDNKITPTMRKNTFTSIFTEGECAQHFMNNSANSITRETKKKAIEACEVIFDSSSEYNHKKLVYYRLGNNKTRITYKIADLYEDEDVRMGNEQTWKLSEYMETMAKNRERQFILNMKRRHAI